MVTGATNLFCLLREAMEARGPEAATRDVLLVLSTQDAEVLLALLNVASEIEKKENPNIKNWF
jgi:hypothetical protein